MAASKGMSSGNPFRLILEIFDERSRSSQNISLNSSKYDSDLSSSKSRVLGLLLMMWRDSNS